MKMILLIVVVLEQLADVAELACSFGFIKTQLLLAISVLIYPYKAKLNP